jgi:CDP-diacylglycerol--glycerol-3-phosphate 3-phosphatidyltransferase
VRGNTAIVGSDVPKDELFRQIERSHALKKPKARAKMRKLSNILSIVRIILSPLLLWLVIDFKPIYFILVYVICALADVIYSCIARKLNAVSELGVTLDTLGDFVFTMMLMGIFWISLNTPWVWAWVAVIATARIVAWLVGLAKFKQFCSVHTIADKVAGIAIYVAFPVMGFLSQRALIAAVIIVCLFAALSAIEELIIIAKSREYEPNIKSVFALNKARKTS